MQSGEKINFTSGSEEENSTELSRETSKKRGETTSKAELEALEKEYLEELARLEQEKAKEMATIQALKEELKLSDSSEIVEATDITKTELTPEEVEATIEKAKNKSNLKNTLRSAFLIALTTATIALGTIAIISSRPSAPEAPSAYSYVNSRDHQRVSVGEQAEVKSLTGYEVLDETIDGTFLQYDNIGCYESEEKTSPNAVGNPNIVLRAIGINPEEATAEQRGAAQEYFVFSMEEPAASVAIVGNFKGFEGLTQDEAENKIHNMSDEEKADLQDQLKAYFDKTEYHYETGSGPYRNQYIYTDKNGEKHSGFVESDLTGKRILVGVTTLDDGTTITWMSKEDCGNNEDRIIVTPPDGPPEVIIIDEGNGTGSEGTGTEGTGSEGTGSEGTGTEGTGSEGTGSEGTGTEGTGSEGTGSEGTGSEDTGSEGTGFEGTGYEGTGEEGTGSEGIELEAKDEATLIENATPDGESGLTVDVQELDEEKTPPTTLEEDEENFEAIEKQIQEDAEKAAEAERIKIEQEEAQRKAAEEAAERRRQEEENKLQRREEANRQAAEADEAAARAAEGAAKLQPQAAEADAEAEAARIAQEEADRQAAANAAEAESNANATAAERADMFNNGDF